MRVRPIFFFVGLREMTDTDERYEVWHYGDDIAVSSLLVDRECQCDCPECLDPQSLNNAAWAFIRTPHIFHLPGGNQVSPAADETRKNVEDQTRWGNDLYCESCFSKLFPSGYPRAGWLKVLTVG